MSAFILRATEMPRDEAIDKNPYGFKDYGNAIWCTFITVLTSKSNLKLFLKSVTVTITPRLSLGESGLFS